MIRILKNQCMYKSIMTCVIIEGKDTDAFDVKMGIRKGFILSPIVFNITLDYMMSRAMEGKDEIQVGERILKNAEYADDASYYREPVLSFMYMYPISRELDSRSCIN